jgi:hypothetical protein
MHSFGMQNFYLGMQNLFLGMQFFFFGLCFFFNVGMQIFFLGMQNLFSGIQFRFSDMRLIVTLCSMFRPSSFSTKTKIKHQNLIFTSSPPRYTAFHFVINF